MCVNFRPTEDPDFSILRTQCRGLRQRVGPHGTIGMPVVLAGHHHVQPARQRPELGWQRVPRLAPHDDRAAHGGALEMRHVFRQMPGQGAFVADDAVAGAGEDEVEVHAIAKAGVKKSEEPAPPSDRYRRLDRTMAFIAKNL